MTRSSEAPSPSSEASACLEAPSASTSSSPSTPAAALWLPSLQATRQFDAHAMADLLSGQTVRSASDVPPAASSGTITVTAGEVYTVEHAAPSTGAGTLLLSAEELAHLRDSGGYRARSASTGTVVLTGNGLGGARHDLRSLPSAPPVALGMQASAAAPSRKAGGLHFALLSVFGLALLGVGAFGGARILLANSRSWIAPTVLSKSDARVVEVSAAFESARAHKSELGVRKAQIVARLDEIDRELALETSFRASFEAALRADLASQRAELARMQRLVVERDAAAATRTDMASAQTRERTSRLELDSKVQSTRQRIQMLQATLPGSARSASAYGALSLRREYDLSRLESDRATAEKAALAAGLTEVQGAVAQNQTLLDVIESSPYRLAAVSDATLGFVPYDNVDLVRAGSPLMACRAGTLLCTRVGTVDAVLPDEVRGTSPVTGKEGRGRLVRITLTNGDAATRPLLFASTP